MPSGTLETLSSPQVIGLWLQAVLTFAILSFLIADNPFYKFAEHIFVGVSAGYGVVLVWHEAVLPILLYRVFPQLSAGDGALPNYWVIVPGVLGLMMIARFIPKLAWLSRWPIAFVVGVTTGASIPVTVQASLLEQMHGTIQPLLFHRACVLVDNPMGLDCSRAAIFTAFNSFLLILGVVCTLSYFYFSHEHKRLLGVTSRIGIWFLMVAFGAGFGNTVMARISLLIGRVQFLLYDWWPAAREGVSNLLNR
ncbi:MAG: hypothetical protein ACYC63_12445 [Armatimonadota bacterium]